MTLPSRIFLIGLPGAGKSTVGDFIAKEIDYRFVDLDHEIEKSQDRSISEIFENKGESHFRKIESKLLRQTPVGNVVLATGGGAPCFYNNMDWMNENGFTIFLNPPLEIIISRLTNQVHRPLIGDSPKEAINNLFRKRIALYQQAGMESVKTNPFEVLAELHIFFSDQNRIRN